MNCEETNPRAVLDHDFPAPVTSILALSLAVGELLAITDAVATTIRIDSGEVRISEEGSFIDHVLCAGQQYAIDRSGRAIVAARTESRITLFAPRIGFPPRRVERCDPGRATNDRLYVRPLLLNVIAGLIPLRARRPALVIRSGWDGP